MISNDLRHENYSQLVLADVSKCSKRYYFKSELYLLQVSAELAMPLFLIVQCYSTTKFFPSRKAMAMSNQQSKNIHKISRALQISPSLIKLYNKYLAKLRRKYTQVFNVCLLVTPFGQARALELTSDVSCLSTSRSTLIGIKFAHFSSFGRPTEINAN